MTTAPFSESLSDLCNAEARQAAGDPQRLPKMASALMQVLAWTLAVITKGDDKATGEIVDSATVQIMEMAAEHAAQIRARAA